MSKNRSLLLDKLDEIEEDGAEKYRQHQQTIRDIDPVNHERNGKNTENSMTDYLEETPDDRIARIIKQRSEKGSNDRLDGRTGNSQGHDEYDDGAK